MINERGLESALSACPRSGAASLLVAGPHTAAPVYAASVAGVRPRTAVTSKRLTGIATPATDLRTTVMPVQQFVQQFVQFVQIVQIVPNDPGALTRRPPA
jgi:hypothetical protein